ncbi:MAG: hypothetical protein H0W90_08875 [Actinobacteria bacterium]|nr:hypothetical protein [Actinomycetota bacterium]
MKKSSGDTGSSSRVAPTRGDALAPPEQVRTAFAGVDPQQLESERIHRFILGIDDAVRVMSDAEAAEELNDPFAKLLLRQGQFPTTLEEIIAALERATEESDPLRRRMSFIVGEGSQIPFNEARDVHRGLRLVVTFGRDNEIDVMVSTDASGLTNDFLQVIGWDDQKRVFHYYERLQEGWIWAGNSSHALDPRSRGQGPFDSHINGSLVLKELKLPWNHWKSFAASMDADVFSDGDPMRTDPLFIDSSGAEVLEERVVRPGVRRWTDSRFDSTVTSEEVKQADTLLRQLFETTTINLVSSATESRTLRANSKLELPPSFFLNVDELVNGPLDLAGPPDLSVSGEDYLAVLDEFDVALVDGQFRQKGDTHFAFLVPERSVEDIDVVRKCVETGLLSKRFVACALMVDFSNPVFSERRASLSRFAPESFTRDSPLEEAVARAIVADAESAPQGSAEREFAELWGLGEGWRAEAERRLHGYYDALSTRLKTRDGVRDVFRLAEARRTKAFGLDISERRPLLFATSTLRGSELFEMTPTATIQPAATT